MSDPEEARKKWLAEKATYEEFANLIADRVKVAVQAKGLWSETSARSKDVPSLVKKLLKGKHSYDSMPDKAGARCIVRYLSDLATVVSEARALFSCSGIDDKREGLSEDRIGYISIHLEVRLKDDDPKAADFPPDKYCAELQIRTLAQHLWAEMAHGTYKNDESLTVLPADIRRRVNLMAGLIEVADQEFDRLNQLRPVDPAVQVYKELEPYYYRLTSRRPDTALSLTVIEMLMPLYGAGGVAQIAQRIREFFNTHQDVLNHVYSEVDEWKASAFLYQPEALMIIERLEADELETRRIWSERFPESELERVATPFGISFD
jgi:ppGpp synthetase/RelA/SpoT-type nucleotidyltranferase